MHAHSVYVCVSSRTFIIMHLKYPRSYSCGTEVHHTLIEGIKNSIYCFAVYDVWLSVSNGRMFGFSSFSRVSLQHSVLRTTQRYAYNTSLKSQIPKMWDPTYIYLYMYIQIYVCMYNIYIYIYIYIYTYRCTCSMPSPLALG
jgi:hypothetical protein